MAKDLTVSLLLDFYGDMLTEKQRDVVDFYYNQDLSLSEIADNEGITRQGVRDNLKRAEGQLRDMEARLGLVKRFDAIRGGLDAIVLHSEEIMSFNAKNGRYKVIDESAESVVKLAKKLASEI